MSEADKLSTSVWIRRVKLVLGVCFFCHYYLHFVSDFVYDIIYNLENFNMIYDSML